MPPAHRRNPGDLAHFRRKAARREGVVRIIPQPSEEKTAGRLLPGFLEMELVDAIAQRRAPDVHERLCHPVEKADVLEIAAAEQAER